MPILLALAVSAALAQPAASPAPDAATIVVTGARSESHPLGRAEAPYSETTRLPLGSRIGRRVAGRPFRTIASDSGVAGMLHGSGMDGTGSASPIVSNRRVTDCVADDRQVRPQIACILFRAQRDTALGELDAARAMLAPLLARRDMNDAENHHVGHVAYALAEAQADDALRAQALRLLLVSGRLPAADRARAAQRLRALTERSR